MKAIHQFTAGFSKGDAISNEALLMRSIFRSWGYQSEIYSETSRILPELRKEVREISEYAHSASADDAVLLHLSIGSVVNRVFSEIPGRKALLYHNITPPEMLKGLQPQTARNAETGIQQAKELAGMAEVNLADSRYNADELKSYGYQNVSVLPLILDLKALRTRVDRKTVKKYRDGLSNVLFVGRCVPNKRIEDILAAFYYYQRYVETRSRLIHAGSFTGTESYHAFLLTLAHENGVENLVMPGAVPQTELNAYFETAEMFLCMSEHEGFCIPLLEAMSRDVPVLAYDAGAVAETMDSAGILIKEKRYDLIAEMMGRIHRDAAFRESILQGQRDRISRYQQRNLEQELRNHLSVFLK